jgi:hypothetical protein
MLFSRKTIASLGFHDKFKLGEMIEITTMMDLLTKLNQSLSLCASSLLNLILFLALSS